MGGDSNPRDAGAPAGFQDRCLQPLGHPSSFDFQYLPSSPGKHKSGIAAGLPRGSRVHSTKRILASRSALAWRSCSIASSIATVTFAIPSSNAVTLQAGHAKQEGDLVVNVVERHRWLGSEARRSFGKERERARPSAQASCKMPRATRSMLTAARSDGRHRAELFAGVD